MPIGTSDGQYFDSEFDYAVAQTAPIGAGGGGGGRGWSGGPEGRSPIDSLLGITGERYRTWPELAIRDFASALMRPGNVAMGKEDPLDVGANFNLASNVILAPAGVVNKVVDGTLGSIAGVSSKTYDPNRLSLAQHMSKRPEFSPEDIWRKTGWYQGLDQRWRYEIDPGLATINRDAFERGVTEGVNLPELLNFPDLYRAYPDLKNSLVFFEKTESGVGGFWKGATTGLRKDGTTWTMPEYIVVNRELLNNYQSPTYVVKSTLLHEIQHGIQAREKFDFGTNPEYALERVKEILRQRVASGQPFEKVPTSGPYADLLEGISKMSPDEIGYFLYRANRGEIEARTVRERMLYSSGHRVSETPLATHRRKVMQGEEVPPLDIPGVTSGSIDKFTTIYKKD